MLNEYNNKSTRFIKSLNPIEDTFKFNKGLLNGITDAVGLTDYSGERKAQKQAQAQAAEVTDKSLQIARENIAFQKEQFEFQREQYGDWENTFGDLSENLGEYYKNLSSDKFISSGLTAVAKEYQVANKELQRTLAQRGISSSGVEAAALTASSISEANAKANVRIGAEDQVANKQVQFLGLGLGQGTAMLGQQVSQAGNVGGAFNSASGTALQGGLAGANISSTYANTLSNNNAAMMRQMVSSGGDIAGGFMKSDIRLKSNIEHVTTVKNIKFYTWDWNNKATKLGLSGKGYGVIAQEIKIKYPDLVTLDGEYLQVNYAKLAEVLNG